MADRKSILVSKLRPKSLGNPKVAAGFSDAEMGEQKIHPLGIIMGRCGSVKKGTDPKDDSNVYFALLGAFEGVPADPALPIIKSGVCYLPGGVHEMIVESVQGLAETERGGVIEFAMKLGTKRDTNQAGYSYVVERVGELTEVDPLAQMKSDMGQLLALPAPNGQGEAATDTAAPKAKSGSRRR